MAHLSDRLLEEIERSGYSYGELATLTGIPKATIQRYATGLTTKVPINRLKAMASVLCVSPEYLMGWFDKDGNPLDMEGNIVNSPANIRPIADVLTHKVRVISHIAAGQPLPVEDEWDMVDAPIKADYALIVEGDSMEPDYIDGDIIYLRAVDDVADGQIAAVLIDDAATLKRVYHISNGVQLIALNPRYAPMTYAVPSSADTIRIMGVPVGYTRMFK